MVPEPRVNRRDFMGRCVKAALAAAAAGAVGLGFHDPRGPDPMPDNPAGARLPDFSVPGIAPAIAISRGRDRRQTVGRALAALGGMQTFVVPGDRVLLKVNAAFAAPPMLGATSHPDLVAAVTRGCLDAGAAEVVVTDNPINDPAACFALSGIAAAARKAGARVVLPRPDLFTPLSVPGARRIRDWPVLFQPFHNITKVIGLAPVKDHHRSGASLSMKNWYGLLGGRRNVFHQDIHTIITELAMMMRPTLVILDGTVSMITNGPTGGSLADLKPTETIIAATDQVAADACAAALLEKTPAQLPFIARAEAAGVGRADYRALKPIEVRS